MWLFFGRRGKPYSVSGWKAMWQRRMRAYVDAGGMRFWEHDIRATAGTEVEEQRGAEEAQKLLGHSDLRTTRVYTGRRKVITVLPNRKRD
jgi:integrase